MWISSVQSDDAEHELLMAPDLVTVQDGTRPAQKVLHQGGECACGPAFGFLTS
jgi:hypothetical protein